MKHLMKQLIDDGVLDYADLVLKYYHKFDLSEREAIALIKLHKLLGEDERIIKPEKFSKWLAATPKQTENILNSLVSKGYLTIGLDEDESGKQQETFNVDFFLNKVAHHLQNRQTSQEEGELEQIIEYLEDMFQRPLSQFDLETIRAWVYEEQYDFSMIQSAAKTVMTYKNPSIKQVDRVLLNRLEDTHKAPKKNTDILKEFQKLWEE